MADPPSPYPNVAPGPGGVIAQPVAPAPHPAPPHPPELPEGVSRQPRWPAWYAPAGFALAFAGIVALFIPLGLIAALAGASLEDDPPALTIIGVVLQDAVLVGAALFLASRTMRPRLWHFGLRRVRPLRAFGWAVVAMVSYYVFAGLYSAIVKPDGEQTVAEDLGADESQVALVAGAVVVVVLAPVIEEFFFRGFFYRALRSRFGVLLAAAIGGAVFGVIHYTGPDTLEILPILAALGFAFCLLYEKTGSLYPCIGLHAFNNMIAYSVSTSDEGGWMVSVPLGLATIAGCFLVPRYLGRRTARPGAGLSAPAR